MVFRTPKHYPSYYPSAFVESLERQEREVILHAQMRVMSTMMGMEPPPPIPLIPTPPTTTKESEDMMEVGKVVLVEEYKSSYSKRAEQALTVQMSEQAILVDLSKYCDLSGTGYTLEPVLMSPEKTIELAQLMLKAAELQPEYAAEAKRLREESDNLATKYKDMISGLGLEHEVDVLDDRGTFTVVDSVGKALT